MTPAAPLLTVAMPVYNAGKYLRPAVLSIVEQSFEDWELLIIDDGSTDESLQSIAEIRDERIHVIRDGANRGLAARLNECIDLARGSFLARMDQDDVSYPDRFAKQLAAFQADATLDLLATRAITIDEEGNATGIFPFALSHLEVCARPWRGFHFPHPTWMGRLEWFRKHRYMEPQQYFCEDQELLLRSYRESRFACVPEVLFAYRIRNKINPKKQLRTRMAVFKVQLRYFSQRMQFYFILMSFIALVLRIGIDIVRFLRQQADARGGSGALAEVPLSELNHWEALNRRYLAPEGRR